MEKIEQNMDGLAQHNYNFTQYYFSKNILDISPLYVNI